jgi:hypothetical protein
MQNKDDGAKQKGVADMDKYMMKCRFCGREFPFEKIGYHMRKDHMDAVMEDLMLRVGELEIKLSELEKHQGELIDGKVKVKLSGDTINSIVRDLERVLLPRMTAIAKHNR